MSRVFGVDFRDKHVRVAALRTGYRKIDCEAFAEELIEQHASKAEALRACLARLPLGTADMIVAALDGGDGFSHRLQLPESARKRLLDLLPFELEGVVPLEIDELVMDHVLLTQQPKALGREISVLVCAAPIARVKAVLEVVQAGSQHQPERVAISSALLGNLAHVLPGLPSAAPVAFVDFGYLSVDICVIFRGEVAMLRTLSGGVETFPDSAELTVSGLRQTMAAFMASSGAEVQSLYVTGDGANMSGLHEYLAARLGVEVLSLPACQIGSLTPHDAERLPLFARALGAALQGVTGKGLDLRKGPLAFERGYQHLKARAPLSASLLGVVLVSFLFSIWAESRALDAEHEAILKSLELVTQSTFGQATSDPDEAEVELEKARKIRPEDPMPYMDGLGAAVALAEVLPADLVHDTEEFDFDQGRDKAKGKLKIRGQVGSADDAQKVAQLLSDHVCLEEAKITKITQVVNSEKERYALEALVSCPEDKSATSTKKEALAKK